MATKPNTLDALRDELFDTLRKLREATGETSAQEISRAKAVVEVSGAIIDIAKIELQFLDQVGGDRTPPMVDPRGAAHFFGAAEAQPALPAKGLSTGKTLGGNGHH